MSREIGIILVHGIGNQAPGQQAAQMMVRLCDDEACCKPHVHTTARSRDAIRDQASAGEALTYRFNVRGEPVQLLEANWAPLSHPDNPPCVLDARYILPEFLETVSSAWVASPIARLARRLTRRQTPTEAMLIWGTLAILITTLFLLSVWRVFFPSVWRNDAPVFLFGIVWLSFVYYLTYLRVRRRWLVLRHTTRARRIANCAIYSLFAWLPVTLQPIFFMVSAEILLFMAIPVVVAVAVNKISFRVARLFVGLGRRTAACRMGGVTRWVHRLGWVLVVLPVHTLLQATKASGNLMSILFGEKQMKVKAIAACWLVGVYPGFLAVLLFSELLIVPAIWPFMSSYQDGRWTKAAILFVLFFPVYLLLLKVLLTPIDLLLDVGNYHIASMNDRGPYHQRIDQAVQALCASGGTEIHIVAHSLGSVIVYDWLSTKLIPVPHQNDLTM
jgi:hypothetical protein